MRGAIQREPGIARERLAFERADADAAPPEGRAHRLLGKVEARLAMAKHLGLRQLETPGRTAALAWPPSSLR